MKNIYNPSIVTVTGQVVHWGSHLLLRYTEENETALKSEGKPCVHKLFQMESSFFYLPKELKNNKEITQTQLNMKL
jgi:hypothetical protein